MSPILSINVCAPDTRRFRILRAVAMLLLAGFAPPVAAQGGGPIVCVEEDWELVVGEPDPSSDAPQITCAISPLGHLEGLHATFELNHQTQPSYAAGGMQLQLWGGEDPLATKKAPVAGRLSHDGETVRWTQQMRLTGGGLSFEIFGGTSQTWGAFGGQGHLKISQSSSLEDLRGYDPGVSTEHSGIGFSANRVAKLVCKEVRWYTAQGLAARDTTPRVVHEEP